ncbi:disease resistance protein At4g27190-like [Solanum dulcamara]|uniref:disease resistance protein At4g27190-like n=1 Tax=Solanum dulcamara TaxID=45834 RepID=UPI002486384F|nr:disease resistance protein At4g27190-like [Solanum dulcamara]
MKKVEFIPGPSIEGQSIATRNLNKILRLLEDKVCKIGVWGTGGVGKTTLVKNLNNELLKIDVLNTKLSFGVVIWVTVPKPPIDIRKVQAQIASRLNLKVDNEGSVISIASKIHQRLKQEKSFHVWEAIDLDYVGVPQPEYPARSKIIVTSRFLDVCRQMKTRADTELNVSTLEEDESWQLFVKNAGDVANLEHIQPLAKDIARECGGLPLAITVIGTSMRGKTRVELWEDALKSLRMSEPHNKDVEKKVYMVIKSSFDSLESQNIELSSEQRNKHVNKQRADIKSCFLYCSLYPVDIPTDDLINCWWAEGILGEHDSYEEAHNRGITTIRSLIDACLLETHEMDFVKMHDVVRDVAKWIANTFGDDHISVFQAGIGLAEISHIKVSASVKRISFASNRIECLPDCFTKCPETTSLLLQDNEPLVKTPHEFFLAVPSLRVLNLSGTAIRELPSSINSLCQLRALILQNCDGLKDLPPIGNLCNLQLLDFDNTRLRCLPQGIEKLTNLRLLSMPASDLESSIGQGFFLKLSNIEILNMMGSCLGATSFDEISSLHNLTSLFIRLNRSSIFNRDHTWMKRLKRFRIEVGKTSIFIPFNKSRKEIIFSKCEIFSSREVSGMLQFASHLYLEEFMGLRKLFAYNSFDGLKSLHIESCSCDFGSAAGGSGQIDPLPNLEHLSVVYVDNLKSISHFGHLRFSDLRRLDINICDSLTCLFNVGGAFSVPKHLEEITIDSCSELVELFVQSSSSQIPMEHLEELKVINCNEIRKLPFSIQTSNNIKVITGTPEWWSQLEWDDDNFKSNLEHCFTESYW